MPLAVKAWMSVGAMMTRLSVIRLLTMVVTAAATYTTASSTELAGMAGNTGDAAAVPAVADRVPLLLDTIRS